MNTILYFFENVPAWGDLLTSLRQHQDAVMLGTMCAFFFAGFVQGLFDSMNDATED